MVSLISVLLLVVSFFPGESVSAAIDIKINGTPLVSDVHTGVSGIVTETVVSSESGGTVSIGGSVTGDSDAEAVVRSIIRGDGSNTRVYIDARTESDGDVQATSVARMLEANERLDIALGDDADVSGESEATENASVSGLPTLFERFYSAISKMAATIFFFW